MKLFISAVFVFGVVGYTHGIGLLNVLSRPQNKYDSSDNGLDDLLDTIDIGAYDKQQPQTYSSDKSLYDSLDNINIYDAPQTTKKIYQHRKPKTDLSKLFGLYNHVNNLADNQLLSGGGVKDVYSTATGTVGHVTQLTAPLTSDVLETLPIKDVYTKDNNYNNKDTYNKDAYNKDTYGKDPPINQVYKLPNGQELQCIVL